MARRKNDLSHDDENKLFELLEMLAAGAEYGTVPSLARRAGISRYKMTRLLAALEHKGLVECAVQSGRYDAERAGILAQRLLANCGKLGSWGKLIRAILPHSHEEISLAILKDARPILEGLARQHNEAIYMALPSGDEVLLVDMVDCARQEKVAPVVGKRFPFFMNAAGKVMRAIDSWDLLEKIGRRWRGSRGCYPDLAALQVELEQIREKGVAIDGSGMGEGVVTVAVAVRDYAGKVVGALMMIGPSLRLFGERLEREIIPSLRLGAESLSRKFGYARP